MAPILNCGRGSRLKIAVVSKRMDELRQIGRLVQGPHCESTASARLAIVRASRLDMIFPPMPIPSCYNTASPDFLRHFHSCAHPSAASLDGVPSKTPVCRFQPTLS